MTDMACCMEFLYYMMNSIFTFKMKWSVFGDTSIMQPLSCCPQPKQMHILPCWYRCALSQKTSTSILGKLQMWAILCKWCDGSDPCLLEWLWEKFSISPLCLTNLYADKFLLQVGVLTLNSQMSRFLKTVENISRICFVSRSVSSVKY